MEQMGLLLSRSATPMVVQLLKETQEANHQVQLKVARVEDIQQLLRLKIHASSCSIANGRKDKLHLFVLTSEQNISINQIVWKYTYCLAASPSLSS